MASPCRKGGMRLSEALDNMQLAYNPITKQLHFVSPKQDKPDTSVDEVDKLSKKSSFSDEGNFSISTCEKSDTSDSPRSTLQWSGAGHTRGKDGGSFSSTVSSLSECSLDSGRDDDVTGDLEAVEDCSEHDASKLKKKGISGFFSRGVFQWKSSKSESSPTASAPTASATTASATTASATSGWRLFKTPLKAPEPAPPATPRHRRTGSASDDLVASSLGLIQHDRPSNLPAKCLEEACRHRAEHLRVVAAARRRVEREAADRLQAAAARARLEDTLSAHARQWREILGDWDQLKNTKRTQELWWCGLPPPIRGKVWQLAIENKLGITPALYQQCAAQAKEKLHRAHQRRKRLKLKRHCDCRKSNTDEDLDKPKQPSLPRNLSEQNFKTEKDMGKCCSASDSNLTERCDESGMELIELDIARTFPQLCIFQPGGPYFHVLHELLAAYVCYRPDIGYVQGMSFIAAVLILNMEAPQAFTCFANLLDGRVLQALYSRDGGATTRLWRAYSKLLSKAAPSLAPPAPELYLLEWIYTAFAKAMPLDAACRVWDLMLRDGDLFLFRAAIGVMLMYEDQLQQLDFIAAAQFLTRLPEDLDPDALFRHIAQVSLTQDNLSFHELAEQCTDDDTSDT